MAGESRVRIGVLNRTYGLAGGIRCTLDADAIPAVNVPCDAWSGYSEKFTEPLRLIKCERRTDGMICYFAGCTTREDAAQLLDRALYLPMTALDYDQPHAHPLLVGYDVRSESGEELGKIGGIFKTSAHYIWVVESEGNEEWMLPAVDQFIVEVRHDDRIAIVRPIPGMKGEETDDDGGN
ncbi:MAG: ribosome maturation factor RimM [Candidatus Kapaibacterium sp.]